MFALLLFSHCAVRHETNLNEVLDQGGPPGELVGLLTDSLLTVHLLGFLSSALKQNSPLVCGESRFSRGSVTATGALLPLRQERLAARLQPRSQASASQGNQSPVASTEPRDVSLLRAGTRGNCLT